MRNSELSEGIEVFDKNDKVVGTSRIAAKKVRSALFYENITQHYSYVIMSAMASWITSVSIVCLTVCSKKTSKFRVTGLCEWPHKGPVTGKCFHLMTSSWIIAVWRTWWFVVFLVAKQYYLLTLLFRQCNITHKPSQYHARACWCLSSLHHQADWAEKHFFSYSNHDDVMTLKAFCILTGQVGWEHPATG